MKRMAFVAASVAAVGLTACTHSTAPHAAPVNGASSTPIVPVSCSQQYQKWANGEGKGLMGALNAVTSAATARNTHALTKALKQARPAVAKGAAHPIPACADPRGYWSVLLMHVNAAAAGKASAPSVRAASQDLRKIHQQLLAEVKQIAQ
jgi:hypothetical protein